MFGLAKIAYEFRPGDKVKWSKILGGGKFQGIVTENDGDCIEVLLPNGEKKMVDISSGLSKIAKSGNKFEEIQHGYTRDGIRYGVTISKDKDGYFAHTHRARCKSYPSMEAIPVSKLKFIDSTG